MYLVPHQESSLGISLKYRVGALDLLPYSTLPLFPFTFGSAGRALRRLDATGALSTTTAAHVPEWTASFIAT